MKVSDLTEKISWNIVYEWNILLHMNIADTYIYNVLKFFLNALNGRFTLFNEKKRKKKWTNFLGHLASNFFEPNLLTNLPNQCKFFYKAMPRCTHTCRPLRRGCMGEKLCTHCLCWSNCEASFCHFRFCVLDFEIIEMLLFSLVCHPRMMNKIQSFIPNYQRTMWCSFN